MLSTATHSKLREALDETDTQVATYAIDRWTAKMKGAEEYITKELPPTTLLMILFPNDHARPLTKSSQKPSS